MFGEFISEKCIQIPFAHKQNCSLNLQIQIVKPNNKLYNLNHTSFILNHAFYRLNDAFENLLLMDVLGEFISEKCIQIQFAHKQNCSLNLQMQIDKSDNNLYNLNHASFILNHSFCCLFG